MRVFLGESDPRGRRLTRLRGAPSSTGDRNKDLGADCVVTTATTVLIHVIADAVFDSVGEPSFHLFHNDVSDAAYYVTSLAALTCGFGVHASFASSESLNVMPIRCSMQVRNNKSSSSLLHTSSAYTAGIDVSSNTIGEQGIAASRPLTVSFVDVIGPVKHPPVYVLVVASKLVSASLDTEWVLEVPHKQLWPPPMQCELQGDTVQMVVCSWVALDENEPEVRSFQFQQPWPPPAVLPRYFTAHLAHAYSVAGAVVLLCPTTIATHAVQRVFGKLISQCLLPFCPISAQVAVKAPWSPFILFEIKGDAVHLRPVPWPFFGAYYAAPVHLKTTLSSSGSVVQIFVWPILMHEISAATMEHFLVPAQHKGNLLNPDAVFHKLLSGLCGTKFLWMLQGECASCYAGDVQNELWLGDYISVFAFGGMSLWPSWVQGDNQHQPWPPPTEKRLTTCDAELRPVPWPLFHLIERCSCQSSRIWKPPWHVPVPQEISSLQTTDLGDPGNTKLLCLQFLHCWLGYYKASATRSIFIVDCAVGLLFRTRVCCFIGMQLVTGDMAADTNLHSNLLLISKLRNTLLPSKTHNLPWDPGGSELVVCIVQWQYSVLNLHHPSSLGTADTRMEVYAERLGGKPHFKGWGMSGLPCGPRTQADGRVMIYKRIYKRRRKWPRAGIESIIMRIRTPLPRVYCSSSSPSLLLSVPGSSRTF